MGLLSAIHIVSWRIGGRNALRCAVSALLVVLAAAMLGPASSAAQDLGYRLGSGDQVKVTVFGHPDLSGQFDVSSDGRLALPLVGEVRAQGLTPSELESAIAAKLKPDYLKNPQLSVEVVNYRPFYIIGEVKTPGSYPYVGGMRVVNAVSMAGGVSSRARESQLFITRAGDGKKEAADQNTLVLPGDVIEVPERFF